MMWHITVNIKLPEYGVNGRNNQRDFIYYIEEQIRTILHQRFRNVDISYHTDYSPDPVAARPRPESEFERMYLMNSHLFERERELTELLEEMEEDLLTKDFIQEKEMEL